MLHFLKNKKGFTPTLTFTRQTSYAHRAHCKSKCRGFTLIELLVVVAVIGILSSADNDGGYYPSLYYEVGQQPGYCMGQYTVGNRDWVNPYGITTVCAGGN